MSKICYRGLNRFQVYSFNGDVRLCGWMRDMHLGNLIDNTVEELFNNEAANRIKNRLSEHDYSMCMPDHCPYAANKTIKEKLIEFDPMQRFPSELALAFEQTCNYACTGCPYHSKPKGIDPKLLEHNYSIIEERIREALPYAKTISANGCGELFASKHILRLLSEWKPSAKQDDVRVFLETNGSMFDEAHWSQIDNLGKYRLSVSITVMSFDEDIYRYLSGTNLPIERIENNLRFVKSLREAGIINELELCTVVQEQNFREMPLFTKRCIEEFGADTVRLRPYAPLGAERPDVAWFKNPRNPRHPLYNEYKRVMGDEIFQHPAVSDWSGGCDSQDVSLSPYEVSQREKAVLSYFWINNNELISKIYDLTPSKNGKVGVYGATDVAKAIVDKLDSTESFSLEYMLDRDCIDWFYRDKRIWRHIHVHDLDKDLLIIIAVFVRNKEIIEFLKNNGYTHIVSLDDLVNIPEVKCGCN